ncbi:MAG: O-antigen ligase family protein, partial [Chloroflexota bacterium]
LLGAGLIAAAIGWWEISQAELAGMSLFRGHITRAGSVFRLTGPFDYANQAAMFTEATLPFLAAAAWSVSGRKLPRRFKIPLLALLFLLTLFYVQALILTLSRAGAATVVVVCLLLAALLAVRQPAARRKMAAWWLGLAGITAVLIAANLFLSDQARLRLQGGNIDNWYRAQIIAPPTLELAAGATIDASITVVNQSVFVWRSHGPSPILLGARLLNEAGTQAYSELRWPFPGSVHPQETVQIRAAFTAPLTPGIYELRWDVVQEDVTWFGANSGLYATSLVTVLPAAGQAEQPDPFVMSEQAAWEYSGPIPDRSTLWAVALHMIGERPLSGIGLDNFRLTYGERLGNLNYDKSVHTNNFYLEMFVSMGIIGTFPFIIWSAALLIDILRTLRRPHATMWQAASAAGLLAYYIHGFFDFFLLFNATGLLFWLLTALWLSEKKSYAYWI